MLHATTGSTSSSRSGSVIIAAIATTVAVTVSSWIGYGILAVKRSDKKRLEYNEKEWKIQGLPWPTYWVRWLNHHVVSGGPKGWYVSIFLPLLKRLLVDPATRKSLKVMDEADQLNKIDKILCDSKARFDFQQRLEFYYKDIWDCPTLTPFGKVFSYVEALASLQNHAGLLRLAIDHMDSINSQKIDQPVFIVSFSRTGTTILHRTMALDRQSFRNFDVCDMLCPLAGSTKQPAPRWDTQARKAKAQLAQTLFNTLEYIYPNWMECMETMHGTRPNEADEDMLWHNSCIGHPYMAPLMKLYPQHRQRERLWEKKQQSASEPPPLESKAVAKYKYAWLKLMMKLHQHIDRVAWEKKKNKQQGSLLLDKDDNTIVENFYNDTNPNGPPWLMKEPNHSMYLPELMEAFPDARLAFTHRLPADVVPSLAKLVTIFISMDFIPGTSASKANEIGLESLIRTEKYANGIVSFTKSQPQDSPLAFQKAPTTIGTSNNNNQKRRLDFWFRNVVTDIPKTIDIIYDCFFGNGKQPTPRAKQAFQDYLEENQRHKLGNQPRSLKDFGLTQDQMDTAFKDYNDLFITKYK